MRSYRPADYNYKQGIPIGELNAGYWILSRAGSDILTKNLSPIQACNNGAFARLANASRFGGGKKPAIKFLFELYSKIN
jgi:hypothetical protein